MRNAFSIVEEFERRVAEYAGAKHAVAVDCCTNGIFLSLHYANANWKINKRDLLIPARTYCSVPMACIHAGWGVEFGDIEWRGIYQLWPLDIWDGAKRFTRGMYEGGLHCLSFHAKKILAIGRGGMILTDNADAAAWLRKARYDGRDGRPYTEELPSTLGWHMYMTPEQAARGLQLLDILPATNPDQAEDYPDLRTFPVFQEQLRAAA